MLVCLGAVATVIGLEFLPTMKTQPLAQTRLQAVALRTETAPRSWRPGAPPAITGLLALRPRTITLANSALHRTYGFEPTGAVSTSNRR